MCNYGKAIEALAHIAAGAGTESDVTGVTESDFRKFCRKWKVSPVSLDEMLFDEFGYHGQEIMDFNFGNGTDF